MPSDPMSKSKSTECVKVVVRCRPMSSDELASGYKRVVDMDLGLGQVILSNPKAEGSAPAVQKVFSFDAVYNWESKQHEIFEETARPIVDSCLDGYNGTIFAYGQTGAGKTYTMSGLREPAEQRGIIPTAFEHIFGCIQQKEGEQHLVRCSYLEIYNEDVRDLMGKEVRKLELKESPDSGVYVKDLTSFICKNVAEIEQIMKVGSKNRHVAATQMNEESSRSHSIFTIVIETSEKGIDGAQHIRVGKLNLVDLAGSERAGKTGATGERLTEGIGINLSLSALGNVISALVSGRAKHVPYRDSKLTRLLQDSLGGNTKTVMIANIGPADYNYEETLSTVRYADRAKNIKNKPRINEDPKDAMLREFQDEIKRLKELLEQQQRTGISRPLDAENMQVLTDEQLEKLKQENELQRQKLEQEKTMAVEEKVRVAKELESRFEELEKERVERDKLAQKLKAMEETVTHAGVNLLEKAKEQEEVIHSQETEIHQRKLAEVHYRQQLAQKDEALVDAEEKYKSVEEEAEVKTRKLKKLFEKYQETKQEVKDLQDEFEVEREEMLNTIREYEKQLKMKDLIIESFIPPEEVTKITRRAAWDEERGEWEVQKVQFAGNNVTSRRPGSAFGARRPTSEYARIADQVDVGNPRFRGENVLTLDLDMPERTTVDYSGPESAAALLQVGGMHGDEELLAVNESNPNVYFCYSPSARQVVKKAAKPPRVPGSVSGGAASMMAASSLAAASISSGRTGSAGAGRKGSGGARPISSSSAGKGGGSGGAASDAFPSARGLVGSQTREL